MFHPGSLKSTDANGTRRNRTTQLLQAMTLNRFAAAGFTFDPNI
jgi:hypothetical protein